MSIALENISFAYADTPICHRLSWTLPESGIICLRGASGSGKTTLLRLLAGLEQPIDGHIHRPQGTRLSMVFQEDRLLPWRTTWQNIALVCDDPQYIDTMLKQVGLAEYRNSLPSEMSGGQQRRVALVRALAADSTVLLLDEPFTGLDNDTKALIFPLIREAARTKPILLVTHDNSEAEALHATVLPLGNLPLTGQLDI